jgi:hypothetical protein
MTTVYLQKLAAWARNYRFDFGPASEVVAGETLSAPSVTSSPAGLTVGTPAVSERFVVVLVSGGTAGTDYLLTCTVTLSGGGTLTHVGGLTVID